MDELRFDLVMALCVPLLFLCLERYWAPPDRPWVSAHLATDAIFGLVRIALFGSFFAAYAALLNSFYQEHLGFLNTHLLDGQPAWIQFAAYFVMIDFAYYWFHRLTHAHKLLWVFHAVHHSQRQFNPMLQNRGHPLEEILYTAWLPVPLLLLGGSYPVVVWFVIFNAQWSYFVHSDIRMNLGPLKYLLVTPQYHRVHHSLETEHFDKNFSGRLIIWDYLFGTLVADFATYPPTGVHHYPVEECGRTPFQVASYYLRHLVYPFAALWSWWQLPSPAEQLPEMTYDSPPLSDQA